MTCNKVDGIFSWQGQASLGGHIGSDSASLQRGVVGPRAAGTYLLDLLGALTVWTRALAGIDLVEDLVISGPGRRRILRATRGWVCRRAEAVAGLRPRCSSSARCA